MKPDKKRIIAECDWAIQKITDFGFLTMTSRKFFQDVKELLTVKKRNGRAGTDLHNH